MTEQEYSVLSARLAPLGGAYYPQSNCWRFQWSGHGTLVCEKSGTKRESTVHGLLRIQLIMLQGQDIKAEMVLFGTDLHPRTGIPRVVERQRWATLREVDEIIDIVTETLDNERNGRIHN